MNWGIYMSFEIRRLVLESANSIPILEEQYEKIRKAKSGLLELRFLEEKFDLIIENYIEFELAMLDSTTKHMLLHAQDYRWFHLERSLFNRRLINLLTTGRAYIDSATHHIKEAIAPDKIDESIEGEFARQYDSLFGYRVMEALRNHVQHRGFPIYSTTYPSKWVDDDSGAKLRYSVTPYINTNALGQDRKFKVAVLKELQERGEKVDVKMLVREYVEGLGNIHNQFRNYLKPYVKEWESALDEVIIGFQEAFPEEGSVVGLAAVKLGHDGKVNSEIQVFQELVEFVAYLKTKNRGLDNLKARYVTNEIL